MGKFGRYPDLRPSDGRDFAPAGDLPGHTGRLSIWGPGISCSTSHRYHGIWILPVFRATLLELVPRLKGQNVFGNMVFAFKRVLEFGLFIPQVSQLVSWNKTLFIRRCIGHDRPLH